MNDEIKPLYIPTDSGNALPDLGKHGAHNETPIPLHRTRTEPSRAMSDEPMKHLLPSGTELRDIIRRRIKSRPMSAPALWAALCQSYQTRPRQEQSVIDAVAGMLAESELEQRDGKLHVVEPTDPPDIDPALWTMTHTARVMHVLTAEAQTRDALARATGLNPKQVSKAMYLLIQEGKAEVVGDNPRTWRKTEAKKMDADDVCKAVLEKMGGTHYEARTVVADISRIADWPHDDATALFDDMLVSGYLVRRDDGRIMSKDAVKTEPETAVLSEEQTRGVLLERLYDECYEDVVIEDVTRLSGWKRDTVAALIESMLRDGDLSRFQDGRLISNAVKSEDPPEYEIGDDDDGEISEPGIARPVTTYRPASITLDIVRCDAESYIAGEYTVVVDADGLKFGDGDVLPFEAIDALMPVLRRVHRAVFGDGD